MSASKSEILIDEKEFVLRADFIDESDLDLWNVQNAHFDKIQKALINVGAKLLVGPRGTGKTHQMLIAHNNCIKDSSKPLPVYVTFGKYFLLERFLNKAPNAMQIFHTWVLCKIVFGCYEYLKRTNQSIDFLEEDDKKTLSQENIGDYIDRAEKLESYQLITDEMITKISISKVIRIIETLTVKCERKRAVLMLDDTALTFTPQFLIEFFDIYRSLKTKLISPKASTYPGTTEYGPRFHVGHDADTVECWLSVEDDTYISFMKSLIDKRFTLYTTGLNNEVLELLMYASFGVPRAFINMLRNFKMQEQKTLQSKFNSVIDSQVKLIESEYLSFVQKMPRYEDIIETGYIFFKRVINDLKNDNKNLTNEKSIIVGIEEDSANKMIERMTRFLMEAGLLYEDGIVKHGEQNGEQREYKKFIPHLIFLIQNRTFSEGRGFSVTDTLINLKLAQKKHPLRRRYNTLLTLEQLNKLKLNLPPCQVCNTKRLTEEQRFCHNCGTELVSKSAFEECMKIRIEDLPMPQALIESIKNNIQVNTVGDVYSLTNPGGEFRKIKGIGKVKSERIINLIRSTIDEFLT